MTIQLTIGSTSKRSRFQPLPVEIDFAALPEKSREFVTLYGLKQYLADGMAGAESQDEAHNGVRERIRKLVEADFSRSRGEERPDTEETRALKLARQFIRDKLKAANQTAEKEAIADGARKLVESQPKWKIEARKQLEAEAKTRSSVDDEETAALLADLLGERDPGELGGDGDGTH